MHGAQVIAVRHALKVPYVQVVNEHGQDLAGGYHMRACPATLCHVYSQLQHDVQAMMCLPVVAGVVKGTVLLGMLVVIVLLGTTLMSLFDVWHVLQVGWVPQ